MSTQKTLLIAMCLFSLFVLSACSLGGSAQDQQETTSEENAQAQTGEENFSLQQEAIQIYTDKIQENPNDPNSYFMRGSFYEQEGKITEGLTDLNKAIELNPTYAEAYVMRGVLQSKAGKNTEAIADFDTAIELNNDPLAYLFRGSIYKQQGKTTEAQADFDTACQLNPEYYCIQ